MADETKRADEGIALHHLPAVVETARGKAEELAAAGVHRETLEAHLDEIERAAAHPEPDHGAIETLLTDLRGLVTSASNKLVTSNVLSLIDQALGFAAP
jgi:hypothetical protein